MSVQLDGFAAEAIDEEAKRLGVSIDELVAFSVLYYLADADSGRIARETVISPYPHGPDGLPRVKAVVDNLGET